MAVVDMLVVATLVVGVTLGSIRGFVPQVTGIFGLGGGLYLASRYHEPLKTALFDRQFTWSFNGEAAFITIIVVTVILAAIGGFLLRRLIDSLGLVTYDRIVGGAFGAAKASLLAAGILLGIVYFAPDGGGLERAIGSSRSGPVFWRALDRVTEYLPNEVAAPMDAFLDDNQLPEELPDKRARRPGLGLHPTLRPVPEPDEPPLSLDE